MKTHWVASPKYHLVSSVASSPLEPLLAWAAFSDREFKQVTLHTIWIPLGSPTLGPTQRAKRMCNKSHSYFLSRQLSISTTSHLNDSFKKMMAIAKIKRKEWKRVVTGFSCRSDNPKMKLAQAYTACVFAMLGIVSQGFTTGKKGLMNCPQAAMADETVHEFCFSGGESQVMLLCFPFVCHKQL